MYVSHVLQLPGGRQEMTRESAQSQWQTFGPQPSVVRERSVPFPSFSQYIISSNSTKGLHFVMETLCVYCEVDTLLLSSI
jgi:hypothetical protein